MPKRELNRPRTGQAKLSFPDRTAALFRALELPDEAFLAAVDVPPLGRGAGT